MSSTRPPQLVTIALGPQPSPSADRSGRSQHRAPNRSRGHVPPAHPLLRAAAVITLVSLAGSALAVYTGLSASWWDAVGPTGRLSVPLPMNVVLILLAVAAAGTRRRTALVGATLLTLACTAAVVSGFFDGGYAAALSPVGRTVQIALVLGLATVALVSGRRVVTVLRS